jgi:hypothetical protein
VVDNTRSVTHSSCDTKTTGWPRVFVGFLDQWIEAQLINLVAARSRSTADKTRRRPVRTLPQPDKTCRTQSRSYGDEEETGTGVRSPRNRVLYCSVRSEVGYAAEDVTARNC